MKQPCVILFSLVLTTCFAMAQQFQQGIGAGDRLADAQPTTVGPDAAILTIGNLCDEVTSSNLEMDGRADTARAAIDRAQRVQDSPSAMTMTNLDADPGCSTVVTRSEFDDLVDAIDPNAPSDKQRRFAQDYSEVLLFAHKARELGLDKDPRLIEFFEYKHSQALSQLLLNYMQQRASEISDQEVEKYYKDHLERFQQLALMRIFVPSEKEHSYSQSATRQPKTDPIADEAAMHKVAEEIRREAAAGGKFEKLQERAYQDASSKEEPPEVDLGDRWTPDNLPAEYRSQLMKLASGQVSDLLPHLGGWEIFKVVARRTIPLNEAKPFLQALRMKDWRQAVTGSLKVQYNEAYFAAPLAFGKETYTNARR
jgi:parvulin-like peptidyl-prolyl isomerase